MSDVKLMLSFHQFDWEGQVFLYDPISHTAEVLGPVNLSNCANIVRQCALSYSKQDLTLIGDNRAFLEGIKDSILTEYETNYAQENLNITIIAE